MKISVNNHTYQTHVIVSQNLTYLIHYYTLLFNNIIARFLFVVSVTNKTHT